MARPNTQEKLKIEDRRRRVASLYLMHMTQEEIGRQLGVDQRTVGRDIEAIRESYRRERTEILDREAAELDQMERDCAVEFARTKDREWVTERRGIKERRSKLFGLDAPTKVEASGPGGTPLRVEYVNDWRETGPAALSPSGAEDCPLASEET
jgi:hypothetical protein